MHTEDIRALVDEQGNPWFVAKDVCDVLGFNSTKDGTRLLDADEKGGQIVPTLGGPQNFTVINESGLYSLILPFPQTSSKSLQKVGNFRSPAKHSQDGDVCGP